MTAAAPEGEGPPEVRESPALQADTPAKTERLVEIANMADLLTDRLLNDQIMGRAVSKEDIAVLLKASSLLKDYGQPIPPLLSQIVQDFGDEDEDEADNGSDEEERQDTERLARSLRPFKGLRDQEE